MTIGTSRAIVGGVVIIGVIALGFLYYSKRDSDYSAVTNFSECKQAGYPIMESYPEKCQTPDGRHFTNDVATTTPSTSTTTPVVTGKENLIRVTSLSSNQVVTSPLTVQGTARGYWYFEASFPVELLDGNGKVIASGPATARTDWMTEEFVPFSITLTFVQPTTSTGTLVLRKDNPSGLPENDNELRIPVRFSTAERSVSLFYYDSRLDKDVNGNILCSAKGLVSVTRTIPITQTPLQDTLRLMLTGNITAAEKSAGITTEFPLSKVSLVGATLPASGALTISLADPLNKTSGGACRAQVLRAQVEATAKQFSSVKSVTFSPATVFQP